MVEEVALLRLDKKLLLLDMTLVGLLVTTTAGGSGCLGTGLSGPATVRRMSSFSVCHGMS